MMQHYENDLWRVVAVLEHDRDIYTRMEYECKVCHTKEARLLLFSEHPKGYLVMENLFCGCEAQERRYLAERDFYDSQNTLDHVLRTVGTRFDRAVPFCTKLGPPCYSYKVLNTPGLGTAMSVTHTVCRRTHVNMIDAADSKGIVNNIKGGRMGCQHCVRETLSYMLMNVLFPLEQ